MVTLAFIVLGLAGWGLARQMDHLADDLPTYRVNILAKIADVRGAGKGGSVEKLQETIEEIKTDLGKSDVPTGTVSRPVVVTSEVSGFSGFAWLGPIVSPLGTAGLVLAMVVFMLLERRDLRDRLIGLFGHRQLAITTKAFDEAATRVSRQLLMQSLVDEANVLKCTDSRLRFAAFWVGQRVVAGCIRPCAVGRCDSTVRRGAAERSSHARVGVEALFLRRTDRRRQGNGLT
jgi:hypothetical protein